MPGLGSTGGSKFQVSVGWHEGRATQSFHSFRVNGYFDSTWAPRQRVSILDVTARYVVNSRVSILATLPIVSNKFSMLFPPNGPPRGIRYGASASGLGDLSLFTQYVLLKPDAHPFGNIAVGLGIKVPTGNWDVKAGLPDLTGLNFHRRTIYPPAIMPGDGGTGIIAGITGYKNFRGGPLRGQTVFGSASYLCNPANTNGTPSIVSSEGVPLAPQFLGELTNSVTDSYNAQVGASIRIPGTWDKPLLKGLRAQCTFNIEGIPNRDLIGASDGFRQPGYILSVAPGLTYSFKRTLLIAEVPIVFSRYIKPRKSAIPDLNTDANGNPIVADFDPTNNLGMIPRAIISLRMVHSF